MLASKDVRVITASLSSASLLELQEIPKSAERLPARTFYLWHVDLARAYTALISHLYKTMANLIQRKKFEVGKMEALMEKRNRTDVKEDQELLSKEDRKEIERLDEVVEKLTLAEQRTGEWRGLPFFNWDATYLLLPSLSPLLLLTRYRPERLHPPRSTGWTERCAVVRPLISSFFLSSFVAAHKLTLALPPPHRFRSRRLELE